MADRLSKAMWPTPLEPVTLEGAIVRLEPIVPTLSSTDLEELATVAADPDIWRNLTTAVRTRDELDRYLADLHLQWEQGSALPFLVRFIAPSRALTGRIIGTTRLKDAVPAHRRFKIGSWYTRSAWGTGANSEAKALILDHAFDALGAIRVELEADVRNERSCAALRALGATEEGILRSHRIRKDGTRRDSVLFSVIDTDWPALRTRILARAHAQASR